MWMLHQLWLSAPCRKVRLALGEKGIAFEMKVEPVWERRRAFLAMNPAGEVPVLVTPDGVPVSGSTVICEYLDEVVPDPPLLGRDAGARAEARRLAAWFDTKFESEVTRNLVGEKVMKRFFGGEPDSRAIRAGKANLRQHLDYIAYLTERRGWLAGRDLTFADLAAAAQLSSVDYIGDVPWDDAPEARAWYARIKSRPSFRPLLDDYIPGTPPARHYADLDF